MSSLFPDIIFDVLLRLPVKTLLRFRCISKSYCTLIDNPDFIKAHLDTSIQTKPRKKLILLRHQSNGVAEFYAADHNGGLIDPIKLKSPIKSKSNGTRIVGSCNSLVLLMQNTDKLLLWNPFTTQYKILPEPQREKATFTSQYLQYDVFGLGYDAASDDYKVVRIQKYRSKKDGVGIYSLRSNSWTRLHDFPCDNYEFDWTAMGKHVSGTLYWLCAKETYSVSIVAFDILTEKFHALQIPAQYSRQYNKLHVVEGRLCLSSRRYADYHKTKLNLYVGEKHGARLTWSKMGKIMYTRSGRDFSFLKPFSCLKDGDKVLLDIELKDIIWYGNMEEYVEVWRDLTTCWENLVSLGNGNAICR
ncbi:F-box/kelch-repeat protein At3g06240 [Ricinus communis]|uniref:F-box/kelch-repeat protein At3g06240 n=1 Tax=Ricinus communis TaxID=3988 RepID=UPI00201AE48E|nr:F-box/kelch-repeat protein At3g06240 [Ricinus communis]